MKDIKEREKGVKEKIPFDVSRCMILLHQWTSVVITANFLLFAPPEAVGAAKIDVCDYTYGCHYRGWLPQGSSH